MSAKLQNLIGGTLTGFINLVGPAQAGCRLVDCVENLRITPSQVGKR